MKKTFFATLIAVFLFGIGCNITQEYKFNKDLSGSSNMEIDISALIGFMGSMDSLEGQIPLDSLSESFKAVAKEFEETGATNVKYGWKNNKTVLYLNYDYKDLDLLNKILATESSDILGSKLFGDSTEKAEFTKKGRSTLIYDAPEVSSDSLLNNGELESMKDYYNYTLIFNFATEIKKMKSEKAVLSSDKKSLEYSGSLIDFLAPGYTTDFEIKLKK